MTIQPNIKLSSEQTDEITPDNAASRQRVVDGVEKRQIIYDQPWLSSFGRPLLVVILVSCCSTVLVTLVQRLVPSLSSAASNTLLGAAILAAAVATISSTILAQPAQRLQRTAGYRLAELGILLAIARVLLWFTHSGLPSSNTLITTPLSVIFDGIFWAALIIISLSWSVASEVTSDLQQLALQADELYVAQHHYDRLGDVARTSSVNRTALLNGFVVRWVSVGMLMLFLTAIIRRELPQQASMTGMLGVLRQQIEPGAAGAIIIYFLCGLLLIGLSQLALLRSRWILEKMPMRSNILSNWPWYVTLLVGIVAMLAALMPLGDTFLLAKILNAIIGVIFMLAWGIMQFFMGLLMLLIAAFGGKQAPPISNQAPAQTFTPPPAASAAAILPAWTGGLIFWLLMAFLLGNAALIYFGGKHLQLGWLRWLWNIIRLRWRGFVEALQDWQQQRLPQFGTKLRDDSLAAADLDQNLDPDKLSALEQVRFYYLSLLRSAERAGIPRAKSETPLRYAPRLHEVIDADSALPNAARLEKQSSILEIEPGDSALQSDRSTAAKTDQKQQNDQVDEVNFLTKNFVSPRYAGKEADAQTLTHLRKAWKTVQDRLNRM